MQRTRQVHPIMNKLGTVSGSLGYAEEFVERYGDTWTVEEALIKDSGEEESSELDDDFYN